MTFWSQTNHQSDACEMLTMAPLSLYQAGERCLAALEIMDGVLSGLKVHREIMAQRAGMFWAQATSLANTLVKEKAIPFRSAHQIIAVLVRMAYDGGKSPSEATTAMVDAASREVIGRGVGLAEKTLRDALDPASIVKSKKAIGGTAPERVQEDLRARLDRLKQGEQTVAEIQAGLARAEQKLEAAMDAILGDQVAGASR
jgi:argininosuccinate lyase